MAWFFVDDIVYPMILFFKKKTSFLYYFILALGVYIIHFLFIFHTSTWCLGWIKNQFYKKIIIYCKKKKQGAKLKKQNQSFHLCCSKNMKNYNFIYEVSNLYIIRSRILSMKFQIFTLLGLGFYV